jgi:septum formation protein
MTRSGNTISEQKLILASSSPRRQELLREAGIPFQVHPAHISEDQNPGEPPLDYALRLAEEKAVAVAQEFPGRPVLGADTIVVVDQEVLGKPRDREDAARMLRLLSGRSHQVITALCLVLPPVLENGARKDGVRTNRVPRETDTRSRTTRVSFRKLAEDEIQQYIAGGEPMDKAGAYAIQGGAARWTDRIEGDYSNVVGLPLSLVAEMLRASGLIS